MRLSSKTRHDGYTYTFFISIESMKIIPNYNYYYSQSLEIKAFRVCCRYPRVGSTASEKSKNTAVNRFPLFFSEHASDPACWSPKTPAKVRIIFIRDPKSATKADYSATSVADVISAGYPTKLGTGVESKRAIVRANHSANQ